MPGLALTNIININVSLQAKATARRNFGVGLVIGPSAIIGTTERLRAYSDLTSVAVDFHNNEPEYQAAKAYFAQKPTPSLLYIGRWDQPVVSPAHTGETLLAAVQAACNSNTDFYSLLLGFPVSMVSASDVLAVADFIEASSVGKSRIFGLTLMSADVLDPNNTTSIGYQLHAGGYSRTFWQYSSTSAYAHCSFFGRAATVNFNAANSAQTMMFKVEPTILAETITQTANLALKTLGGNVFVNYENGVAIVQYGTMASGTFFDEIHNSDWMANAIQTAVFNALYTSTSKVPQTDRGSVTLINATEFVLAGALNNGILGAGTWTRDDTFGQLRTGDFMPKGFYVYMDSYALQSDADRALRKSPPIQVAAKFSGAVHSADVVFNINR